MTFNLLLMIPIVVALVGQVESATEHATDTKETPSKPAPVEISARTIESDSKTQRKIEIELAIGSDFEIYSAREHDFILPLKVELLDAELQPIKSSVSYPTPKTIKEIVGDYYVYHGNPKFTATCAIDTNPIYVSVFYHGHNKAHSY